ncbi:hypothetical protein CAPTEDRAFT_227906 [Capitella teleta]|uniref:Uncharacterized protein n=1 Tax=Capitella teleta TaxID=283909 RepID=R7U5H2_CAPTE|nr:hypothetical protein CAPTEDRAFT_227906 [Capitella teleta]|eukprot:ELU01620.1 hypothetical protein CAPTEDRAFT_227906 [Capitella teleta]
MSAGKTEYQEEYCGMGGSGGGGRGGTKKSGPAPIVPCRKSEDEQPVGGRCAAKYRTALDKAAAERAAAAAAAGAGTPQADATSKWPVPAFESDFVAEVYKRENRGTHNAQPKWKDQRLPQPVRAANSTLYETADRDPCQRKTFEMYKSTAVDALSTPCAALTVPDVHKLRYMHNNYMSADDWY